MWYKIKKRYVGTKQVRPNWIQYSVDFRNNSKSNLESEWWLFDTSNFSFSSNWVIFTTGDYWNIYRIIDTTNCKKVKLSWTWYLSSSGGYYWIWLRGVNPSESVGFISWLYIPNWLWVWYNDANHYTNIDPWIWNFSWDIEVDLSTWNFISTCNNWQSVTGTLNSTYLSAIKQSDSRFWAGFNWHYWYFQTLSITAE